MSPESILRRCVVLACFVSAVYGGTAERLAEARLVYGDLLVGALQILPPLFAQFVTLSPVTTMQGVKAARTTGDLPLLPYSMMVCSGFLWMCYGWLAGDKSIIGANISAFLFGIYYCNVFMANRASDAEVTKPLVLAGGAALLVVAMLCFLEHAKALDAVGTLGCFVIVVMFGGPLSTIQRVIVDKSTESLPFPMAVAISANCLAWMLYGLLVNDVYVYGPNGLGLCSGMTQLSLFLVYGFHTKPKE